jgi:hypothetical protein
MQHHPLFLKHPELKEFLHLFRQEFQKCQRPAHEVVMDDEDVMHTLKISKRRLQYLKSDGVIPFHYFDPSSPRTYFLLSDVLEILKNNRIESLSNTIKIK